MEKIVWTTMRRKNWVDSADKALAVVEQRLEVNNLLISDKVTAHNKLTGFIWLIICDLEM